MTPIQTVLPGIVPTRPRDTALGRRIFDAMRKHGIARTLQRMHFAVGVVERDRELEYLGNRRAA